MHHRRRRRTHRLAVGSVAAVGMVLLPAAGAHAAGLSDLVALASCSAGPADPELVQLTEDVTTADVLTVACDAVIDLNGYALTVGAARLLGGNTLTITDTSPGGLGVLEADATALAVPGVEVPSDATLVVSGGDVTALGGENAAGIGGDELAAGGEVYVAGGTVTATGGWGGAGIGGGTGGDGGTTTIEDGTVTATGGVGGAGIGGGRLGYGGTTTIEDGTVTATGTERGAGIGGGEGRSGGITTVLGGTVTAYGSDDAAGIGSGDGGSTGGTTTINGGVVNAKGGDDAAGIGSGDEGDGGTIEINGGVVNAEGNLNGAGIGAGDGGGDGGTITITGGTVTAVGFDDAAGIGGGGDSGAGGTVTITGGTVTATGGDGSAGIGGGSGSNGGGASGALTITDAVVHVTGGAGAPAIGPGCNGPATDPIVIGAGAVVTAVAANDADALGLCGDPKAALILPSGGATGLTVAGELWMSAAAPLTLPDLGADTPAVAVAADGLIAGLADSPTSGASIAGDGWVHNDGTIALAASAVDVDVANHNYLLEFEPSQGAATEVRVFAGSFSGGYRTAPAPTSGHAWIVDGTDAWWSPDDALADDLTLVEVSAVREITIEPLAAATAGDTTSVVATVSDGLGAIVPAPQLVYASSEPTDVVTGSSITATVAGARTITVTDPDSDATATTSLQVDPGPPADLTVSASATSVPVGGSVDLTVTASDRYGNVVSAAGATVTSSVATDVVDGLSVTFPTASPHVLTARLGSLTASVTVEVSPLAVPPTTAPPAPPTTVSQLPATGSSALPLVGVATALALCGAGAMLVVRRS